MNSGGTDIIPRFKNVNNVTVLVKKCHLVTREGLTLHFFYTGS